jgi:hypothetical protein
MKTSILMNHLGILGVSLAALASSANAGDTSVLYTTDNASAGNHVLVITRIGDTMSVTGTYATGGLGLGSADGLGKPRLSPLESRFAMAIRLQRRKQRNLGVRDSARG